MKNKLPIVASIVVLSAALFTASVGLTVVQSAFAKSICSKKACADNTTAPNTTDAFVINKAQEAEHGCGGEAKVFGPSGFADTFPNGENVCASTDRGGNVCAPN